MENKDASVQSKVRLAIVGGGRRCPAILKKFDTIPLKDLGVVIVGVADPNPKAARRGIFIKGDMTIAFLVQQTAALFPLR